MKTSTKEITMKKQFNKFKTFIKRNEEEFVRLGYYTAGAAAGLLAARIATKKSYDLFAARHPEDDLVLKDKNGEFYGIKF